MRKNADLKFSDKRMISPEAVHRQRAARDAQIMRSGLREQVTEHLLSAIFERRYTSGEHLVVQKLSQKLGVSPTPVRESLVELEGLGVVELVPHHGAVVQPFGPRQLSEMAQVRRVLEAEAARSAAGNIPREALMAIREELEALDALPPSETRDRRSRDVDTALHLEVSNHCGSRRLAAEVGRYLALFRALRNVSHLRDAWSGFRHPSDVPEHLAIVDALLSGTADAAGDAMLRHIRSIEMTLIEVLFKPAVA
jgi:DNA-binding GntR family transcriptional regulator